MRTVGPRHKESASILLVNEGETAPTATNIIDSVRTLFASARPRTLAVLFLAGHGVNIEEEYFFVPTNATATAKKELKKESTPFSWTRLKEILQHTKGTRLMFADTCHAGNAHNAYLEKDAGDARIIVFSATKANSTSVELSHIGHGAFTYALINGLNGEADRSKDQAVKVLELGSYLSDEVERLTRSAQVPTFSLSGIEDFVFAWP